MTLKEFILAQGPGLSNAELGKRCMRFLMQKQYGRKPPSLCPCYYEY